MHKKILVPLDGSKKAEMIRPHVRELASRFQAAVILIRVMEYLPSSIIGEEFKIFNVRGFDALLKEGKTYLESVGARLRNKGIACKTLTAH